MEHDTCDSSILAARSYVPRSSAAFQLDDNGRVLGVVANSATQPGEFDSASQPVVKIYLENEETDKG
jgi:hypothetical protein